MDKFELIRSSPDGHCLIYAILNGLKHIHDINIPYTELLDKIRSESLSKVMSYSVGHSDVENYISEMNKYLEHKSYNSGYGDIVPIIIANSLPANLYVVVSTGGNLSTTVISIYNYKWY